MIETGTIFLYKPSGGSLMYKGCERIGKVDVGIQFYCEGEKFISNLPFVVKYDFK